MVDEPLSHEGFDGDKLLIRINVTIAADEKAISPVVDGVMAMARQMKCAEGKEFEIEMAMREALANAVKHGCNGDSSKQIQCCIACNDNKGILIIVRDPGKGFDADHLPNCTDGENLYSNHGRGIYLINQLMDEVKFARNGSEIHMKKL